MMWYMWLYIICLCDTWTFSTRSYILIIRQRVTIVTTFISFHLTFFDSIKPKIYIYDIPDSVGVNVFGNLSMNILVYIYIYVYSIYIRGGHDSSHDHRRCRLLLLLLLLMCMMQQAVSLWYIFFKIFIIHMYVSGPTCSSSITLLSDHHHDHHHDHDQSSRWHREKEKKKRTNFCQNKNLS